MPSTDAFGADIDYANAHKITARPEAEKRIQPARCTGTEVAASRATRTQHISTSYVERQNLTMRMGMRRFTRLTNAFSKKVENLAHAVSLHFMHYNFCRPHPALKTTRRPRWPLASPITSGPWKRLAEPPGYSN